MPNLAAGLSIYTDFREISDFFRCTRFLIIRLLSLFQSYDFDFRLFQGKIPSVLVSGRV